MKCMKLLIILTIIFIYVPAVNASECTNAEKVDLGKLASSVKVGHEEEQGIKDPNSYIPPDQSAEDSKNYISYYDYYNLFFYNITEDITLKIKNDFNQDEILVNYENTSAGTYTLRWENVYQVTSIKYTIMGSESTNCAYEVLKEGVYTLPAVNMYHNSAKCENLKDNALCQKYIYTNMDYETFSTKIDRILEASEEKNDDPETIENKSVLDKVQEFIKNNETLIIIGGVSAVTIIGIVIGLIVRKRKEKLL